MDSQPIISGPRTHTFRYTVNSSHVRGTALIQIMVGAVVLLIQIIYISVYGLLFAYASGWWSWILFFITGCIGLAAVDGRMSLIKSYTGLSVGSAIVAGCSLIMWTLALMALYRLRPSGIDYSLTPPIAMCYTMLVIIVVEVGTAIAAAIYGYRAMYTTSPGVFLVSSPTVQQGVYSQPTLPVVYPTTQGQQQLPAGTYVRPAQQTVGAYPPYAQQTGGIYPPSAQQSGGTYPTSAQQAGGTYPSSAQQSGPLGPHSQTQMMLAGNPPSAQQTGGTYPPPAYETVDNYQPPAQQAESANLTSAQQSEGANPIPARPGHSTIPSFQQPTEGNNQPTVPPTQQTAQSETKKEE